MWLLLSVTLLLKVGARKRTKELFVRPGTSENEKLLAQGLALRLGLLLISTSSGTGLGYTVYLKW